MHRADSPWVAFYKTRTVLKLIFLQKLQVLGKIKKETPVSVKGLVFVALNLSLCLVSPLKFLYLAVKYFHIPLLPLKANIHQIEAARLLMARLVIKRVKFT